MRQVVICLSFILGVSGLTLAVDADGTLYRGNTVVIVVMAFLGVVLPIFFLKGVLQRNVAVRLPILAYAVLIMLGTGAAS